jgi:hypothetical protein
MDKEFIPYEQALALKELGFDEPCLAHLIGFGDGTIENGKYVINYQQVFYPNDFIKSDDKAEELGLHPFGICGVPLYQQAFKWFREKYGLHSTITSISQESWQWHITKPGESLGKLYNEDFYTYEEAESACLYKLIEICKNK